MSLWNKQERDAMAYGERPQIERVSKGAVRQAVVMSEILKRPQERRQERRMRRMRRERSAVSKA